MTNPLDQQTLAGKAIIYRRTGKPQQQTNPPQIDALLTFAQEQGYTNIVLFTDSSLATLLDRIVREDGERITTLIVSHIDRLFRGEQLVSVSAFIALCRQRGITVVTPDMRYDFTNAADVRLFRFQCEDAYLFLTKMVVTRLQQGKRAAQLKRLQAPEQPPYTDQWKYPGRKSENSAEGN